MDINWDSPARGISECRIKVVAANQVQAAEILAPYFAARLRLITLERQIPSDVKSLESDLRWRLSVCADALSAVLTLHLFTQVWLEQGIEQILLKTAPEGYVEKVEVLQDSKNLTAEVADNLRQLNWLRNQFAHRLATKWSDLEMRFNSFKDVNLSGVKPSVYPDDEFYVFKVLDKMVSLTYIPLVEQLRREGVTPKW